VFSFETLWLFEMLPEAHYPCHLLHGGHRNGKKMRAILFGGYILKRFSKLRQFENNGKPSPRTRRD
jgi:hypothetical protein